MTEVVNGTVRRTAHPILTRKIWESIGKLQGSLIKIPKPNLVFTQELSLAKLGHLSAWKAKKQKTDIDSIVTELEETDQGLGCEILAYIFKSWSLKPYKSHSLPGYPTRIESLCHWPITNCM